jgi:hypothetical protein
MRAAVLVALLLAAPASRAADDRATAGDRDAAAPPPVEQPFLYMTDTHLPAPKQLVGGYALAFSSSPGAIRPVPGHFDQEAFVHALSLEAGLVPRLTLFGTAMIAQPIGHSDVGEVAVQAGARVLVTHPRAEHWRVLVQAAFLREFGADLGIVGEVTGSYDYGPLRVAASLHAEHLFAGGRDPIDLYAVVGASVRVAPVLRIGAEYVAQDIEASFNDDDAERGARHYVGPDVALSLYRHRLLVTAGSAIQIAHAPGLLARAAVSYVY